MYIYLMSKVWISLNKDWDLVIGFYLETVSRINIMVYNKKLKENVIDLYYKDYFMNVILKLD